MKRVMALFVVALLVWTMQGVAGVPQMINYQGSLSRPDGTPLDTTVSMTFKLYDAATGGSQLWLENWGSVTTQRGLFNVRLGQNTALGDAVLNHAQLLLGIQLGSDAEMTPRIQVTSVGYSYRVGTVDGASGGTISGKISVGSGNTNAGNFTNVLGENNAVFGDHAAISGGNFNQARGNYSVVSGGGGPSVGDSNSASGDNSVIGGGRRNIASSGSATIGGGWHNVASGNTSTIAGGVDNIASGDYCTVGGGNYNHCTGSYATVPGGRDNSVSGAYSFAAGRSTRVDHDGCFVWADHTAQDYFSSTADNQFLIRASGGVGIGLNNPQAQLDVHNRIRVSDDAGNAVVELGVGLDYAEGFDIANANMIQPGTVLVIDPANPGKLEASCRAYDSKVAGIVAGANGLGSGVKLGSGQYDHNVALAGRVYCNVDASKTGIEPGDLLTTSGVPGYAMKATDYKHAQGAILGKAMERLEKGQKGLVLVLVTLQ